MSGKNAAAASAKKVNVLASAYELAALFRQAPTLIEKNLVQQADNLLALYEDPNFSLNFQNYRDLKKSTLELAIVDIAEGLKTLRMSQVGIHFRGSRLGSFVAPLGTSPEGTLVFSVGWKGMMAFQNWRLAQEKEIDQDEINLAIYKLSTILAKVMD